MRHSRGLSKIQAGIIVVIIIVAAVVSGIYFITVHHYAQSITSSTTVPSNESVTVYVAGAYVAILNNLAKQFENATGIPVHVVSGGSFGLAAQIATETPVPANVFIPVAYIQAVELEGSRNPGWAIAFLSDQMSIVYSNYTTKVQYWNQLYSNYTMAIKTNESKYWHNFFYLLATKFSLGIANPNTDPEGLYAYLIFEMVGYLYANHNASYFVDLLKENPHIEVEPTTADYVPSLKAGELDFTFSYVSYAVSQRLEYLQLPPWLSFGYYPNETNWYSQFVYNITVNGKTLTIHGNSVYLFMTVPLNASNTQAAYEFIRFVLSHESELTIYHVTPIYPALIFYNNPSNVPIPIMQLIKEGVLKYAGNFSEI
jgi:molybdate/tungstate transport system substrate-binding protein